LRLAERPLSLAACSAIGCNTFVQLPLSNFQA
jgi:hypothetical protein